MATARVGSLTTCSFTLLAVTFGNMSPENNPQRTRPFPQAAVLWCLSTALLDTSGNLLFIAATRAGRLDVAAVLASLYPATPSSSPPGPSTRSPPSVRASAWPSLPVPSS